MRFETKRDVADALRGYLHKRARLQRLDRCRAAGDDDPDPELREEVREVETALSSLYEEEKYIVWMRYVKDCRYPTIQAGFATRYGRPISESRLKYRASVALEKMAEVLGVS